MASRVPGVSCDAEPGRSVHHDERTPLLLSLASEKLRQYSMENASHGKDKHVRETRHTKWSTVVTVVGAIGLVCAGAVITGSNVSPLLIGGTTRKFRTSVGHLENKSENKEPSRSDSAWRPSISWRHRNARARAYAAEQEVFGDFEADIGSTVAELFAPFGDAEPWRDALAGKHAQRAEVGATDATWARRFRVAARLVGVPEAEIETTISGGDAKEEELDSSSRRKSAEETEEEAEEEAAKGASRYAKIAAWSFARYEPSWTGAYRADGPLIGGSRLSYFPVYKAGNNNIRHSLRVMGDAEEDALNGTAASAAARAAAAAAKLAASLSDASSRSKVGAREDETAAATAAFDQSRCQFTFLRNPLDRFVSAYAEFEYRASPEFALNFPTTCAQGDWVLTEFDLREESDRDFLGGLGDDLDEIELGGHTPNPLLWPPRVGTVKRAKLLLRLLASLRWVDSPENVFATTASLNPANDPLPPRQSLNCVVAFHHFFPQTSNFVATSPDVNTHTPTSQKQQVPLNFVGKLERFQEDWVGLANTCRVTPSSALHYDPLPNGGGHKETSGSVGEVAMRDLLTSDDEAMVAFCLLYLDDFTWGGYELPAVCADSEVVAKLTTKYEKDPPSKDESGAKTQVRQNTPRVDGDEPLGSPSQVLRRSEARD